MNEQEALDLVAEGDRLNDELLAQRAGGTLEVSQPASFNRLQDIAKLGLIYPLDAVCIMTERMEQCHRDKQGRLHRVKGPAVSYRDGFKVWCLNGERQKAPA